MALSSAAVGEATDPQRVSLERRWTMAFAAGLGDTDACYFDTSSDEGIAVHPVFPVCVDWQTMVQGVPGLRDLAPDEAQRGVHVGHDLEVHRPIAADVEVTTWATLEAVERRAPGAYAVIRHEATGPSGEAMWTSRMGVLLLDLAVDGPDRPGRIDPGSPEGATSDEAVPHDVATVRIAPGAAHVYSECARIWNPIHTDAAIAAKAGFDAPILHGTATLGLAVSRLVACEADGDPRRVRRVAARFGAPVLPGALLSVRIIERRMGTIRFGVVDHDGAAVVSDGVIELRS